MPEVRTEASASGAGTGAGAAVEPAARARRRNARELIELVLDDGTFESWDTPVDVDRWPDDYRAELVAARERSACDESVLTGRGTVRGRPFAVLVSEFAFLGGSIGADAADRIVRAVRRATAERLPLVAATASGGTRMQEGTPAFARMAEISAALMEHRSAGLPYLVYLRHPTTGGVYASWGSLGHVTVAEPEALVGFLGPKVFEAVNGVPFPAGVQTAENLAAKGVIDAVVPPEHLRELLDRTLAVLEDAATPPQLARRAATPADRPAWDVIESSRAATRPGVRDLLRYAGSDTIRLRGTDEGERDETILVALTRLDGQPCVVVGQDRARQSPDRPMGPGALREARRAMRLADEVGLPLVTVIDTPGAELSPHGEEGAIAGEIARCIATLTTMRSTTVSVLLGQGCGGGALALLPARTVIAAENAWLSPLPPEGASMIRHGDTGHAAEMADRQRVRAVDLLADGIVHTLVAEPAADTPRALAEAVAAEVSHALAREADRRRTAGALG